MKHRLTACALLLVVFCTGTTAFATDVKLVDDSEKSIFSIFNFFKRSDPEDAEAVAGEARDDTQTKELTALPGTLSVEKNTATDGTLAYETTLNEADLDLQFVIATPPNKGDITVTDNKKGTFTYTPTQDELGEDSFSFTVTDNTSGNSDTAQVTVTITEPQAEPTPTPSPEEPPASSFKYEDMLGHWGEYSAIKMADRGAIRGIQLSDKYYFYPDTELTRGDFILYVVSALGIDTKPYEGVQSPFADAAEIPLWISLPAKAAFDAGIISGSLEDGNIYLRPFDKLTRVDAIMILNNVIKPEAVSNNRSEFTDMYLVPEWARQAIENMVAYGIVKGYDDNTIRPYVKITRATATELIWQTLKYKDSHPAVMKNIYSRMEHSNRK